MGYLRWILAIALGAIVGLLVFGLTSTHELLWAAGATVCAIAVVFLVSTLFIRDEDRDPTVRPPNIPGKRDNGSR